MKTKHITIPRPLEWFGWVLLIVVAFVGATYIGSSLFWALHHTGLSWFTNATTALLSYRVLLYGCMIGLILAAAYAIRRAVTLREAGLLRPMSWKDIGLALLGAVAYVALSAILLAIATQVPGFDSQQTQDLGLAQLDGSSMLMAFVVLVFVAPLLEEAIFRGVLYGKLRTAKLPWWASMLVVSVLFGVAHWQWNVGIDVFALSVVACGLREFTGSIWAGMVLHMIKNFAAFYLTVIAVHGGF